MWLHANGKIDEHAEGPSNEQQDDPSGNNHQIAEHLNETQLKMLLNHLDIVNLVDIVEKMPELQPLIAHEFMMDKYRIHEKLIHIEGGDSMISHDSSDELVIMGKELIEKMLKYFGFAMTKLRINSNHFDHPQMASVYSSINEYCWETLKSVEFQGISINPFENWKHFGAITDLTIQRVFGSVDNIEIHDIFPNLKNLAIQVYSTTNLSFIAHKFPHLEHFKLRSHQLLEENAHVTQFLVKNPKLQSVDLDSFASFEFIHRFQEHLLNLQKLRLASPPRDFYSAKNCETKLHFPNVREFSLTVNRNEHLSAECIPFEFEKLTAFELITPRLMTKWMAFIKQQTELRSILLPETEPTYDQLRKIVIDDVNDKFSCKITEIGVQWNDKGIGKQPVAGIVQMMIERSNLVKVVIWSDQYTDCTNAFSDIFIKWKPSSRQVIGQRSIVTFSM